MRSIFSDIDDISAALKKFTLKLVTPAVEKIGWEFKQGEGFLTGQLRVSLITAAGLAGHPAYVLLDNLPSLSRLANIM